jgi:hypothetical protein
MAANPPQPQPPLSMAGKAREFSKQHWSKAAAWLAPNGMMLVDWWMRLVPIPKGLMVSGALATAILSALSVGTSLWVTTYLLAPLSAARRRAWLLASSALCAVLVGLSYLGFLGVESWWKVSEYEKYIYDFLEPAVYGCIFASLAAFLFFLVYCVYDVCAQPEAQGQRA